jgi:hypothetical protein
LILYQKNDEWNNIPLHDRQSSQNRYIILEENLM